MMMERLGSGSERRTLSPARQDRYLERARSLATSDPHSALENIHILLDHSVVTPEVYRLQAEVLISLGCGTFAAHAAEQALSVGGDRTDLLHILLKAHLTAFNRKAAADVIDQLVAAGPLDVAQKEDVAHAAHELHRYDLAERLYAELLADDPDNPRSCVNFGFALHKTGQLAEAKNLYRRAIAVRPEAANALRLLADASKQTPEDNCRDLILETRAKLRSGSEEYATASFALGKVEEDLKSYDAAFEAFSEGAKIMRGMMAYSTQAAEHTFRLTKAYFDRSFTSANPQTGPQPIFVLGMPRTGSTLIDRILSGHAEVESMGELGCIKEAMKVVTGFGGGEGFHEHFYSQTGRNIDLTQLGQRYVASASPAAPKGRYFIDKYPLNFMDLGLMALALPQAKFIHTLRHPLDTVFGNFKQLFTLGFYPYSYDLAEAAEYYQLYQDLMAFWHERFPGRILDVSYEAGIENPEDNARRIFAFLDLPWDERTLRFHENAAPVDTASLSQVRRPLYKSAVGHWRRYEKHLGAAISILGDA